MFFLKLGVHKVRFETKFQLSGKLSGIPDNCQAQESIKGSEEPRSGHFDSNPRGVNINLS